MILRPLLSVLQLKLRWNRKWSEFETLPNGRELPQSQTAKSTVNEQYPGRQVIPGRGVKGGGGEVREGEARGSARHQVSNTTPKPPYPLTPHPLHLDPCSSGYHHPVITPTPPFYMAHSKLSHQHLVLGF